MFSLDELSDNVMRSFDAMSSEATEDRKRPMSPEQREGVAQFIDAMLEAMPEDGDSTLRGMLAAYVDGLRGVVPEIPR